MPGISPVHDTDAADAGGGEVQQGGRPQAARTDDQHRRSLQPRLPCSRVCRQCLGQATAKSVTVTALRAVVSMQARVQSSHQLPQHGKRCQRREAEYLRRLGRGG